MFIIIGYIVVIAATLTAFTLSEGHLGLLWHPYEMIAIGGITAGMLLVSSPMDVLKRTMAAVIGVLKGAGPKKEDYMDLMKILYEMFMLGRRNGLLALDEHVSAPESSSIFQNYPKFLADGEKVTFLCSALRPIIDGKIKPDQLEPLLKAEIDAKKNSAHGPINVLHLVGDSLPGIGIVAAVMTVSAPATFMSGGSVEIYLDDLESEPLFSGNIETSDAMFAMNQITIPTGAVDGKHHLICISDLFIDSFF